MATLTAALVVPIEALVEAHKPLLDRPTPVRVRIAKGLLPAAPDDLVPTITLLAHAEEPEVRSAARETLATMPPETMREVVRGKLHPAVLDTIARSVGIEHPALSEIVVHRSTADTTLIFLAGAGNSVVCTDIARNAVRCLAEPSIIEALFFNPKAPPGQVQNLLEFAVRQNAELDHIPGFIETRAAILGERGAEDEGKAGLSEVEFLTALQLAGVKDVMTPEEIALIEKGEEVPDDVSTASLQALIQRMSVSQKIRLALVGDANARKLLIRDPKKMVSLAVLKSPRLTEPEVRMFATNKALAEEIFVQIARNKFWTRDYGVRKSLVLNPKCPQPLSMGFLRTLQARDIKEVSKSRDVSGVIARAAKRILDQAEEAKRGNKK